MENSSDKDSINTDVFDEVAFFQGRYSLFVEFPGLNKVILQRRLTRKASCLNRNMLAQDTLDFDVFSHLDQSQFVDLGQVAELIELQEDGQPGILLHNGNANLFPVAGGNGPLRVVDVRWFDIANRWYLTDSAFNKGFVFSSVHQVFTN